jgi:hypothetical protein
MDSNSVARVEIKPGVFVLVDSADLPIVRAGAWMLKNGRAYSCRGFLHKLILRASKDVWVEHINGDKLDNRRTNLQLKRINTEVAEESRKAERAQRFWEQVAQSNPDACWEWQGGRYPTGYGRMYWTAKGNAYTHRIAYELTYGAIPEGLFVCHHCDNPPCCNPAHLFAGTAKDNSQDRDRKGRHRAPEVVRQLAREGKLKGRATTFKPKGELNNRAKITPDIVRAIRRAAANGEGSAREIGLRYGLSRNHTAHIINRSKWAHIE